jgi:hypothetical protein
MSAWELSQIRTTSILEPHTTSKGPLTLGERHLRLIVAEYVGHYNLERNHQGIGNRLIGATLVAPANDSAGAVSRRAKAWWFCSTSIIAMRPDFGSIEFSARTRSGPLGKHLPRSGQPAATLSITDEMYFDLVDP